MKVLVTGANGYIGRHVVRQLCDLGHEVTALDFANSGIDPRAGFLTRDILSDSEEPGLYAELGRPDAIIHMAWKDGFNHNSLSHLKYLPQHYAFIKNMIDSGVSSVSVMGTMHEIGYYEGAVDENTPCNPLSLYGIAKNALRQAVLSYADGKTVQIKWLRAYYILGDDARNKSVFTKILQMDKEGKSTFPFTSGVNKYDFIDVDLLAQYIARASVQSEVDGIINVCTGKPVSLKDKVEEFIREKNLNIRPEYGVYPTRKYDSPAIWGDPEKINRILGNQQ